MIKKIFSLVLVFSFGFSLSAYAAVDLTMLPLGDGKVSTSAKAGYVYSCQQNFVSGNAGASATGSWIHGSTWNLNEKLKVQGKVVWPDAKYSMTVSGEKRIVASNSLPVDSYTGTFPIASTDPAYVIDKNPNKISAQNVSIELPTNPTIATTPSCVGMGVIGVALNGVAIFNALDAGGRDAVAREVQDTCEGHPQQQGQYHYHGPSGCIPHQNENNTLVGYALDGFGIFSNKDKNGNVITNSELDECHGTTSEVMWDGSLKNMYHYVLTNEYPYTIGCYKGTPVKTLQTQQGGGGGMNGMPGGQSGQGGGMPSSQGDNMKCGIQNGNKNFGPIDSVLKLGSKGDEVINLQTLLEEKGFLTLPSGTTKGIFGPMTKKGLIKFQKANNLSAVGTFGPKTKILFNSMRTGSDMQGMQDKGGCNSMQQGGQGGGAQGQGPAVQGSGGAGMNQSGMQNNGMQGKLLNGIQMPNQNMPPKEAINACNGKTEKSVCSFTGMQGESLSGTCGTPQMSTNKTLSCMPANNMMKPN